MEITAEVREELLAMLRKELAAQEKEKKENRTAYHRLCKELEEEMEAFNYIEENHWLTPRGPQTSVTEYKTQWKIRQAIGTLLRVAYQVDSVNNLPANKESEMRVFMSSILGQMRAIKGGKTHE